jgi:hypothetical protein
MNERGQTMVERQLPIIPSVHSIIYTDGEFKIEGQPVLLAHDQLTESDKFALSTVIHDWDHFFKGSLAAEKGDSVNGWKCGGFGKNVQMLQDILKNGLDNEKNAGEEGYYLTISQDGIVWWARSEKGFFYACQTVRQLLRIYKTKDILPAASIIDKPALNLRGIHEDYGRNQLPTIEDHKRTIERMALFKLNAYILYIEPDHIVYDFDPTIGCDYDRFTGEELRELVDYAHLHHVEVIPLIQSMGHMENLLSHPSYSHLAEVPHSPDIAPMHPDSIKLMEKILSEVLPVFDSEWVHLGLDETFTIGRGQSKDAVEERGKAGVFAEWYMQLKDIVDRHEKKMMIYSDMVLSHPEITDMLPKDITMMFWDYVPRTHYQGIKQLKEAGFSLLGLSGSWDWYNLYPDTSMSTRNIEALVPDLIENNGIGHFIASWGDPYGENLSELNWYNFSFCAQKSWSSAEILVEDFTEAFVLQLFVTDSPYLINAYNQLISLYQYKDETSFFSNKNGDQNHSENWKQYHSEVMGTILGLTDSTEKDMEKYTYLREKCTEIIEQLQEALGLEIPDNADLLEPALLTIERVQFVADKYLTLWEVTEKVIDDKSLIEKQYKVKELSNRFASLSKRYMNAWKKTNRPIQLVRLQSLFHKQQLQYETLATLIEKGEY